MLVNTNWLAEYIEEPFTEHDLLKALASTPLEIEAYHPLSDALRDIVVGFIRDKSPIPDVDGMYVCKAEIGSSQTLQVVCASEHPIEVGWGVPIARGGMKLPTGIEIKHGKFHGVYSEGMICLDSELGMLARGSGLQVFHDETEMGRPLVELIAINDSILDLKAPANRPDLLSLIGIAREVAAILGLTLKLPSTGVNEVETTTAQQVSVDIVERSLCPRYMCRLVRNVTIGKSPAWLSSRLRSAGSNPINNVVDVTNFVMREFGQPLHAFDFNTLGGPKIVVRKMAPSESIQLIDGTVVPGDTQPLVIADVDRPVALAGIMGGKDTQINPHTTNVLLEAAYFDPVELKRSLEQLRLDSTDASYRFSRGVDPNMMLELSLERAASLLIELAGGEVQRGAVDSYPVKFDPPRYRLSSSRVSSYLGKPVEASTIQESLNRLGMRCSDELEVEVPTWRADANDAVVLIEDVARLIGYDQIDLRTPSGALTVGQRNSLDGLRRKAAVFLANSSFLECRNITLESEELVAQFGDRAANPIRLINSLKEDMSVLRRSLLPGLLDTVARNGRRESMDFRYFEIDRTFVNGGDEPIETWNVAAVMGGAVRDLDWSAKKARFDFFQAKGVLEDLLETVGITGTVFRPTEFRGFAKDEVALVSHGAAVLGVVGAIDNSVLLSRKIHEPIYGFELNLNQIFNSATLTQSFKPVPRTPAIVRDLALVVESSVPFEKIERTIREQSGELLEEIRCTDVYEGKPIKEGERSISIRLRFRDPQRTLTNEEVSNIVEHIVQKLAQEYGSKLRDF
jgi:phenylalanyl-tRNA synthetase beta chain